MATVDTLKAFFTYVIAFVVVVGGGYAIYDMRGDQGATDTVAILAGFVGAALSFVFGAEVATRTARQSSTATREGAVAHANGLATPGGQSSSGPDSGA